MVVTDATSSLFPSKAGLDSAVSDLDGVEDFATPASDSVVLLVSSGMDVVDSGVALGGD